MPTLTEFFALDEAPDARAGQRISAAIVQRYQVLRKSITALMDYPATQQLYRDGLEALDWLKTTALGLAEGSLEDEPPAPFRP